MDLPTSAPNRTHTVAAAAQDWANYLVDLGHRNSLLHFKDPKTATLDLTAADAVVLNQLFAGRKVRLASLMVDREEQVKANTRARALSKNLVMLDEEQGLDAGRLAIGLIRVPAVTKHGAVPMPPLRAPLLLRRIALTARTAAESDFTLELEEDADPNPVLLYALAQQYGLEPNDLDERLRSAAYDAANPRDQAKQLFESLTVLLEPFVTGLEFEERLIVGAFSFEKMPMVEDLRSSTDLLASHDVIAAIAGDPVATVALQEAGTPSLPRTDDIPPAEEYLVQDADSSQQAAIEAALTNQHLVIDGPPGTGKSQTIANLIAVLAARGKRVLFVAEKRAAIEAVTQRLEQVGLERLVFDLHEQRINKKKVAQRLAEALDRAGRELPPEVGTLHDELVRGRAQALAYRDELHLNRQPWDLSVYEAQAEVLSLSREARTRVRLRGHALRRIDGRTRSALKVELQTFVSLEGLRVRRGGSPWSGSQVRDENAVRAVLTNLDQLLSTFTASRQELDHLLAACGLREPPNVASWQYVLSLLGDVGRTVAVFGPPIFGPELDDLHWATGDRAWRKRYARNIGWSARRRLVRRARTLHRDGLRQLPLLHQALTAALDQRRRWQELTIDSRPPSIHPGVESALQHFGELRDRLAAVAACADIRDIEARPTPVVEATILELDEAQRDLRRMPELNRLTDKFHSLGLQLLLDELTQRDIGPELAAAIFDYAWLSSVIEESTLDSLVLRSFEGQQHSRNIGTFRRADLKHLQVNAARVRRAVADRLRKVRDAHPDQDGVIRKQAALKARHMPIRKLVAQAPDVLLSVYPCWAMSPLVVSRTLPAERLFDVVIFDEASQVEPQDAMPSIMRGRQLIVAGDDKQLPPTNFFRRLLTASSDDEEGEDEGLTSYESILKRLQGLLPQRQQYRLRWHYRSLDERLIAFSNTEIYKEQLVTFPGTGLEAPVRLDLVDGRATPGQDGSAPEEVARVVDLVLDHAVGRPRESLGVITMGLKHADRVDTALRRARGERPELDEFFSEEAGPGRRFFIKSIEQVQGDERDAIILSVGYAKSATGRLSMKFGPLNLEGGERRLNVAVTRSRRRMTVVSSFSHLDMDPAKTESARNDGPELLRRFLEFAYRHGDAEALTHSENGELNGLETSVLTALEGAGINVYPQWGVSEYRIDFALAHPDRPGQMVLAVETDGRGYHSSVSARDRDRLRQDHLERLGWRFHRLWSTDWFQDPERETTRIVEHWERACREAENDVQQEDDEPRAPLATPVISAEDEIARRGRRPRLARWDRIADYSDSDLHKLALWLLKDDLALTRDDRINQAIAELGFQRRGKIIVERLSKAIGEAQQTLEGEKA